MLQEGYQVSTKRNMQQLGGNSSGTAKGQATLSLRRNYVQKFCTTTHSFLPPSHIHNLNTWQPAKMKLLQSLLAVNLGALSDYGVVVQRLARSQVLLFRVPAIPPQLPRFLTEIGDSFLSV